MAGTYDNQSRAGNRLRLCACSPVDPNWPKRSDHFTIFCADLVRKIIGHLMPALTQENIFQIRKRLAAHLHRLRRPVVPSIKRQTGITKGHRLSFEFGVPLYQNLNGPQMETDYQFIVGWQKGF